MAGITPFGYISSDTFIHRIDARFKLLFLFMFSISILGCSARGMAILTPALILMACHIKMPLIDTIRQFRHFSVLMLLLFTARAISTPGSLMLSMGMITVTYEGVFQGTLLCWKLLTIFLGGLIFTATTRTSHIRAGVQLILAPLPLIPEKKVAVMMSLLMRFIPLIIEQMNRVALAQKARGVENRKNPLYRLRVLSIPIMRRAFESADRLALAMEARCYTENRTEPELSIGPGDILALIPAFALFILIRTV